MIATNVAMAATVCRRQGTALPKRSSQEDGVMRAAPSAGILLLQKLCQHGENESKRKRAHNEMHDQPPLAQLRVVAHHFGLLRDSRENSSPDEGRSVARAWRLR
jgi:hypothetical protein